MEINFVAYLLIGCGFPCGIAREAATPCNFPDIKAFRQQIIMYE